MMLIERAVFGAKPLSRGPCSMPRSAADADSHVTQFDGSLRRLTTLIMASIAFFGLVLLAIIAYAGWASNQTATERERMLLENALNQSIARVLNEQKSVAWWDDSVINITDEAIDLEFVDANFGIFLTETYGQDEVFILNAENRPLYAFSEAERKEPRWFELRRAAVGPIIDEARRGAHSKLRARPDMFSESQSNYRVLAGVLKPARWAGHILSVDGRPAVVAALTIVPNVDMELLKGTPNLLISVKYIDEDFTSEIGRSLLLHDLSVVPGPVRRDAVISEPFVGDDGAMLGYLTWTTRRPGHVLLTVILPLVAFGVVAAALLANMMLGRLRRAYEELALRESKARYQAKHDALSGLPNRVFMTDKLDDVLRAYGSKRTPSRVVAAYVDIDRFKDINDTLGHEAGDQLIKAVAARLQASLRPNDFLARFGGDEFAILTAPAGAKAAATIARRIANVFSSPFRIGDQNIRVTASVGLATAPEDGSTADELMRHADIALYEAKSRGRDRAVVFSIEMAESVERRRAIELDLRAALENKKLRLHYQPIISCATGETVGMEALLRWRHPVHGEMEPTTFIPIAENSGLLPALGEWILDQAMQDAKRWPDREIAVNLSPVQFRHVDLCALLAKLVDKHKIDPRRFVLEITENVLLEATTHTRSILSNIRAMGFRTALDDFGTRYSSLAYLCNFKFDKIKIDRSFVSKLSEDETSKTIVQSVIRLGRALNMDIVAEGVETEVEAVMMRSFGCTELQGFYFSKALAVGEMTEYLRTAEAVRLPPSLHVVAARDAAR
jgi:diguanylate cyclase (GGDEF)-like protein